MAGVKQQVLNWLYSVLTSEYKDVNRTYNDVAQALSHYSSLAPRTDVYTYENGANALLLHVSGILPVDYRGTIYRFPIALWIPHTYPREAPMIYVTPAEGMVVRPGQYVDLQGKVYHPYLANWAQAWDRSNLLEFLMVLRDVFAREPPVVARQQPTPRPTTQQQAVPPRPPPPPGRPSSTVSASPAISYQAQPPAPPPKPGQASRLEEPRQFRDERGPPLPPLPPHVITSVDRYGPLVAPVTSHNQQHIPSRNSSLRYESALPLPPQPYRQISQNDEPVSPMTPPQGQFQRLPQNQQYQQSQVTATAPLPQPRNSQFQQVEAAANYGQHQVTPQQYQQQIPQNQWSNQTQVPVQHHQHYPTHQQNAMPHQNQQPQAQQKLKAAQPPIDLLSEPLTLPTPAPAKLPAPPIPPNPEKDLLLHEIAHALASQRQHTANQNASSLPGLGAQHKAMLTSLNGMNAEIQQLESLSSLLTSNTSILQNSLREADQVIESSAHRKPPSVDDLLVAPTVVGNQLYEAVCEERALGDTLFVLGRAVERGRITPQTFAKMTRGLAREWFLKKALVRKIGVGMGLTSIP